MRNKRILISILVSSILTVNLNAASLWDNNSVFNNVTSSQIVTDPISGGTFISGGAIEVRFKTTGSFPPIFSFGAPSLKASCSGITFDAGYAMFMNLERLGQQLSQAGASLAYGVLIGLVYTMPGVEQAFTKLNEWSQWLQGFLADSCNIGTQIGKSLGKTAWRDVEGVANQITNNIPSPSEYLDKPTDFRRMLKDIIEKGTDIQKNQAYVSMVDEMFGDVRGGAIATYINSLIKRGEENVNFNRNEMIEFKNLDSIGLTDSTKIMAYFISSILDSDIALDETAMKSVIADIKSNNYDKLAEKIEEKGGKEKTISSIQARNKISPEVFVNFLLNGHTDGADSPFENIQGLRVALASFDTKTGVRDEFVTLLDTTATANTDTFKNFGGYIQESKKLVYKTYNQTMKNLKNNSANDPITDPIRVTSAYPVMYDIIRNLVLTTNKRDTIMLGSNDAEITPILDYIAHKNAIALVGIAMDNINYVVKKSMTEVSMKKVDSTISTPAANGVMNDSKHIENLKKQMKVLDEAIEKVKVVLQKHSREIESQDNVRKMNERFIQILRERNLQKGDK
ncbi:conjugal transfer protein TraH [Aliarcobacter butzleri]